MFTGPPAPKACAAIPAAIPFSSLEGHLRRSPPRLPCHCEHSLPAPSASLRDVTSAAAACHLKDRRGYLTCCYLPMPALLLWTSAVFSACVSPCLTYYRSIYVCLQHAACHVFYLLLYASILGYNKAFIYTLQTSIYICPTMPFLCIYFSNTFRCVFR